MGSGRTLSTLGVTSMGGLLPCFILCFTTEDPSHIIIVSSKCQLAVVLSWGYACDFFLTPCLHTTDSGPHRLGAGTRAISVYSGSTGAVLYTCITNKGGPQSTDTWGQGPRRPCCRCSFRYATARDFTEHLVALLLLKRYCSTTSTGNLFKIF